MASVTGWCAEVPGFGHPAARWRRVGLRGRVSIWFAVLCLLLSALLATASSVLVSSYSNTEVEQASLTVTADEAALVGARLAAAPSSPQAVVDRLRPRSAVLLVYRNRSYPSASWPPLRLPDDAASVASTHTAVSRRVTLDDKSYELVGVPTPGGAFYGLYATADLSQVLGALWPALVAVALLAALLGLVIGRVVSRQMLRPLGEVTAAAAAIAQGDLDARLDPSADPELAELARSFNRTAAALAARVRADARFAGDVSHELRTPLTTVLNSIALLQNRRDDLPPSLWEPVDLLSDEMHRFRMLVVDLLEISRADDNQRRDFEQVAIADLVRRAADSAAGRPVTVMEPDTEPLVMYADKRRLERVFTNLVQNADSHGRGCVGVHVSSDDHSVRVAVDDHGPGVAVDRRERIFERFCRDENAHGSGVGLGLAIVIRHVQAHGGEVRVTDRPGGGARFLVELPIRNSRKVR